MVSDPAEYRWSSYSAHALGVDTKLLSPHGAYLALGKTLNERQSTYRELFAVEVDDVLIKEIRDSVSKGLVLGTEKFKIEVETLTGQKVRPLKRGSKSSKILL